jgi:hypothetical protein
MWSRITACFALLLTLALPARAFTPESGFWWNPAEPGSGLSIEIQDNYLFLAAYVYDAQGRATWYTAQGVMQGNARFNGTLDAFGSGQCIGCPWRAPNYLGAAAGPVSINFRTETAGELSWGGRTVPIQRFDFYLTRSAGDLNTELMLGEWAVLIDFYSRGVRGDIDYRAYPYYGDLIVLDRVDRAPTPDYFEGCRATRSSDGFCRNSAREDHDAAGYFNPGTGETLLVVKDVPGTFSTRAVYFAYFIKVGTSQFDGVVEIYDENQRPGDGPFYPVRGFRSASRSFVTTGTGPSKTEVTPADGLSAQLKAAHAGMVPEGLSAAEVAAQYGIDVAAARSGIEALTAHLIARSVER